MHRTTYNRPPRSAMVSLRVSCKLLSPAVGDGSFPLDGALYYHAMRKEYGPQCFTESGQDHSVRVTAASLPLARVNEDGPKWFYACSWAQTEGPITHAVAHWSKRFDDTRFLRPQKSLVTVKSGRYKLYRMPIFTMHTSRLAWYVVGLREWIENMLPWITCIGKKTDQGWGEVADWDVSLANADWSVRGKDGQLMRAIPNDSGTAYVGYRPSYWLPKNQDMCLIP